MNVACTYTLINCSTYIIIYFYSKLVLGSKMYYYDAIVIYYSCINILLQLNPLQ